MSVPNVFTAGEPIYSAEVNQNFNYVSPLNPAAAPIQPAPLVSTPTVTLSTVETGTRVAPVTSTSNTGVVSYANYRYRGGANYTRFSDIFPNSSAVALNMLPMSNAGSAAVVEFYSDDPSLVFPWSRSGLQEMRVICDGVEIFSVIQGLNNGTMQAGSTASTAVLAAGASATNGWYNTQFIRIESGTGAGQMRMISGYVGSTRTATVEPDWSVTPDNTSVYYIGAGPFTWTTAINASGFNYITVDWQGEERLRRYEVFSTNSPFFGVNLSKTYSTIEPAPARQTRQVILCGDSQFTGTGSGGIGYAARGFAPVLAATIGFDFYNASIGGTGYINPGTNSQTYKDRLIPPVNAWTVTFAGTLSGSFTVTQGGTTVTIGAGDTAATIQTAFDTAFGANTFRVSYSGNSGRRQYFFIGQGVTGSVTTAMTLNLSGLSGYSTGTFTPAISRYLGEIEQHVWRDASGEIIPFDIIIEGGGNDNGYPPASVQAAAESLFTGLVAAYPTARIVVIGPVAVAGGAAASGNIDNRNAIQAAAVSSLPTINGNVPFIDTFSWITGSGRIGSTTGSGNSDVMSWADGGHLSPRGHYMFGYYAARQWLDIVRGGN